MSTKKNEVIDQKTGEIIVVRGTRALQKPPKMSEVTTIDAIAGRNPPSINLKDHPELSGMDIIIMDANVHASTLPGASSFMVISGFVVLPGKEPKEEDYRVIITSAENVQARIADALASAGAGSPFPIKGSLRCSKGGRAWFLD